jgi:hypothetical protein
MLIMMIVAIKLVICRFAPKEGLKVHAAIDSIAK